MASFCGYFTGVNNSGFGANLFLPLIPLHSFNVFGFKFGFGLTAKGILRLNWNQFLFGLILLRPPLFIFLLLGLFCLFLNLILNPFAALLWALGYIIFIGGFMMSLIMSNTDPKIYKSLWGIPKFIFYQVLSLLSVRSANKRSVATKHFHSDKKTE